MRKEWENAWERDSLERHKASSSHWYTRVTCALSPWTGKSIGKSSETKVGLPFLSLLSYPSSVCVGLRPHASGPCFLPKPLIHFPLSFCPPAFFVFFQSMRGETPSLHCLQDLHYPLRPRTNEWEGAGEGGGREWERERMSIRMNQPASVLDALGQVPTLVPHKQREGRVTATGRGWGQSVCVCTHACVCVLACTCACARPRRGCQFGKFPKTTHHGWLYESVSYTLIFITHCPLGLFFAF